MNEKAGERGDQLVGVHRDPNTGMHYRAGIRAFWEAP